MYTEIINPVNKLLPLIYKIEISKPGSEDYLVYIGKSKNGVSRPLKYWNFVKNYELGKLRNTYKKGKIVGQRNSWRKGVHVPMAEAKLSGKTIKLTMYNVEADHLDQREIQDIREYSKMYNNKVMNVQK